MLKFNEILGHEQIKQHFLTVIKLHMVSHAYILSGEKGMGKKSLANAFALTLLCEKGNGDPCMDCPSCRQILSGNHPDLIYVTHEKPGSISVEDIRKQIQDTVMIRPYSSQYKVYIMDEAEKMTPQAQNALLKTIEEPPAYAVILLLTTNEDAFLPTILSRCVKLPLKPLRDSTIKSYLQDKMNIDPADAAVYTSFARGNLGRAITIATSENFRDFHKNMLFLLKYIKKMDISELLDEIKKLKDQEYDIYSCLDFMQMWYRDILMYKVTKDMNSLIFKDEYSVISSVSEKSSYAGIENILTAIDKARTRLQANVNMELAIELLLLVMKEN
ncbi:MAG: DNA polymerase III subunit delta' [Clostridiales bacterium]|nr:DNA polymerase III subunit delta' [Clostridiales bacterium]